jgi:hypothetical protein
MRHSWFYSNQITSCRVIFWNFNLNLRPHKPNPLTKTITTFLSLLMFGFIYQSLLLYDTLAHRGTIQLAGLCIYAACLCVYTALQVGQIEAAIESLYAFGIVKPDNTLFITNMRSLTKVNAVMTGLYTLAITIISFKHYIEFQWTIYRQLNADLNMQKRYFIFKV